MESYWYGAYTTGNFRQLFRLDPFERTVLLLLNYKCKDNPEDIEGTKVVYSLL